MGATISIELGTLPAPILKPKSLDLLSLPIRPSLDHSIHLRRPRTPSISAAAGAAARRRTGRPPGRRDRPWPTGGIPDRWPTAPRSRPGCGASAPAQARREAAAAMRKAGVGRPCASATLARSSRPARQATSTARLAGFGMRRHATTSFISKLSAFSRSAARMMSGCECGQSAATCMASATSARSSAGMRGRLVSSDGETGELTPKGARVSRVGLCYSAAAGEDRLRSISLPKTVQPSAGRRPNSLR